MARKRGVTYLSIVLKWCAALKPSCNARCVRRHSW